MKHLVLIGLPGSGKTTVGKRLARWLGLPFVDLDTQIEQEANLSIPDIFAQYGEARFREREQQAAQQLVHKSGCIVAAGGGVVENDATMQALRQNGVIIFLDRKPEGIVRDIACEHRPLLRDGPEKLYELSRRRRPLYEQYADWICPDTQTAQEAEGSIVDWLFAARNPLHAPYVLIGDPVSHTLSPLIHNTAFTHGGWPPGYSALRVAREDLPGFIAYARENLHGFNCTMPHKEAIIPLLDTLSPEAALSGAVNTVVNRGGHLTGYNTDQEGLAQSLIRLGSPFAGQRVTFLGAGGAARSAAFRALRDGATGVTLTVRSPDEAEACIHRLGEAYPAAVIQACTFAELDAMCRETDLLINATPLGMHGTDADFDSLSFLDTLPKHALVFDMIYNPPRTTLLLQAEKRGLAVANGLSMLIDQALATDSLFFDIPFDAHALSPFIQNALQALEDI